MKEQTDKIRKMYGKMIEHVEGEYHERGEHLGSMEYMVNSKVMAYQGGIMKKEEMR